MPDSPTVTVVVLIIAQLIVLPVLTLLVAAVVRHHAAQAHCGTDDRVCWRYCSHRFWRWHQDAEEDDVERDRGRLSPGVGGRGDDVGSAYDVHRHPAMAGCGCTKVIGFDAVVMEPGSVERVRLRITPGEPKGSTRDQRVELAAIVRDRGVPASAELTMHVQARIASSE